MHHELPVMRAKFESLARRGGRELDPLQDSLVAWLEAIRARRINEDLVGVVRVTEGVGTDSWRDTGSVVFLVDASKILARKLEAESLEVERVASNEDEQRSRLLTNDPVTTSSDPTCAQLKRLKEEAHIDVEALAERVGIEARSVFRHLSGEAVPQPRHLGAYERVFTELLERKILISKTSGKCQ